MRNYLSTKPFAFNSDNFDFWPIYQTIQKYYPIAIRSRYKVREDLLSSYPGFNERMDLIEDNIINQRNYKVRWIKFKNTLKDKTKKPVQSTDNAHFPCFSGLVQLKRKKEEDQIRLKELHFAVSLLGPFFTVYGLDKTILMLSDKNWPSIKNDQNNRLPFEAVHAVTISPYEEYEEVFRVVHQSIVHRFEGYRFVPYRINNMYIGEGITDYTFTRENLVYNLLFNDILDMHIRVRGDDGYGYDEWRVE